MELFTVNRYVEQDLQGKPTNEDEILQNLLKKVEKRKRKQIKTKEQIDEVENETVKVKQLKQEESIKTVEAKEEIDPINEGIEQANENAEEEEASGFVVLGDENDARKRQSVEVVLPSWLAHPTIVSTSIAKTNDEDESNISQISYLAPHIRGALKEMNINRLFPVQLAVVPWILEAHSKPIPFRPRDICVSAPTGSGKTLAFAIPVVQLLSQRVERKIRALVILPVAELAHQVFRVFKKLCDKTDLSVCLLSTQVPFHVEQEKLVEEYKGQYYSKVDIIVTTPGRLVDHLHATKGFCLKELKFLVIDEADRIMDAVFQNWLYHLDAHVRTTSDQLLSGRAAPLCYNELEISSGCQPHKLLFSATLSQDPEKLQSLRLFQPKLFTSVLESLQELRQKYADAHAENELARGEFIGKYTTPAELTEKFCITEGRLKPLTLFSLIKQYQWTKFLCFTNSVESSGRLAFVLKQLCNKDLVIEELSASINVKERSNILGSFARGRINGVVCSDALARGIDIPDVDIVISYDPPRHIKTYIHRIGRTARAGRPGTAITLLTQKEQKEFDKTLAEVGKVITDELIASTSMEETYANEYSSALNALRNKVTHDKRFKLLKKERAKEKALLHKDTSKMSLMEKLQLQASTQVHEKTEEQPVLSSKKNPSKKFKPKKEKKQKQK
ncbi:putative ATP-dependent RNA helicase Dbp73D [Lucilia cuprina]|uniref:ATP-dependent RNA helicase n=1 Tax=Lucilia cuprina TaxID=7375 RepID=A0A0L0CB09_LUCCU|nr:putative ATP-dependent RNA helicase Dbp73D [Lucilia cuprina]KNC29431.1 putative ATP-dependent RNA helicase Dbp73D [Lucilia cuprina]